MLFRPYVRKAKRMKERLPGRGSLERTFGRFSRQSQSHIAGQLLKEVGMLALASCNTSAMLVLHTNPLNYCLSLSSCQKAMHETIRQERNCQHSKKKKKGSDWSCSECLSKGADTRALQIGYKVNAGQGVCRCGQRQLGEVVEVKSSEDGDVRERQNGKDEEAQELSQIASTDVICEPVKMAVAMSSALSTNATVKSSRRWIRATRNALATQESRAIDFDYSLYW